MLSFIFSFLIATAHAVGDNPNSVDGHYVDPAQSARQADLSHLSLTPHHPGYRLSPGMVPNSEMGGRAAYAPTINMDYGLLNSQLSDVRGVLSGGSSRQIRQMAEQRSAAIENAMASAQAAQREVDQLAARTQQMASATPAAAPPLPSLDELMRRAAANRQAVDLSQIPDPSEADLPYQFRSTGEYRDELLRTYKDLYKLPETGFKRNNARQIGLTSIELSDNSFTLGELEDANFYKNLGKAMLDICVGLDPVTGFGRSSFELLAGRNMVTGVELSTLERGFAFLGIVSVGTSTTAINTAKMATRMFHVFDGAARILRERHALETAIREGAVLAERVPEALRGLTQHARITNIHTAEHVNMTHFAEYTAQGTPPFQRLSHVVESVTAKETHWVRVHSGVNEARPWIMRKSAIERLSPMEIKIKFALPGPPPTHISDVTVPKGTSIFRGNVQDHGLGGSGTIQYWLHPQDGMRVPSNWFSNMRTL